MERHDYEVLENGANNIGDKWKELLNSGINKVTKEDPILYLILAGGAYLGRLTKFVFYFIDETLRLNCAL